MLMGKFGLVYWICVALVVEVCLCADRSYVLEFSYATVSPLGVPQQVIAVNKEFPGPVLNVTTNDNVYVNVKNHIDESLLVTWPGVQMRRSSWQDGLRGTNCPIPPRWNWTYQFQVKDQIGTFFYFPSLGLQRASGGFGSFIITPRDVIPLPFNPPFGDFVIFIGDWYTRSYKDLRSALDNGEDLGMPDGVLINGKGPYRYNTSVPADIKYETINVDPGKTYRLRVHNVGSSTCLNFRIQNHSLVLVETEGYYTTQQTYTSMDICVGQSYTFLVSMDQNATSDYYIVASARFVNQTVWQRVTGVAILHYSNSQGPATGPLPAPPDDFYYQSYSMNQALSIRQNVSASGARPNPQGSFRYGTVNVTEVYVLRSLPPVMIAGKIRSTFNGLSFANPETPMRLADVFNVKGDYKLDFPAKPRDAPPIRDTSIINATYKEFVEIVLQNNDTVVQTFHLDGHSFFVVGMGYGEWSENSRGSYNKWDAIARSTVQVYAGGWTAVYAYLDNVGVWNLRTENLDRWHRGQETYLKIVNPEDRDNSTELPVPDNALYCGAVAHLQKPQKGLASSIVDASSPFHTAVLLVIISSTFLSIILW
ncbi:monocopper oxidase-like protein SKS1 [Andrographis paniculata]|uniref:monocopper oxidase-like protein SKS1 n=1 Tax=Andrographis paniculata TaxID=175694 RepID=UPI0021E8AFA6|nr:monocopper oxidase-like protein SKS1 [Andrographis paniculata]XP_051121485.1 monocopper oxidase-like protein SKS1 [Andrographis paniculata]